MKNIRVNKQLKALLDWGCSLRKEVDIPWITRAALIKHSKKSVVIDDYLEYTTCTREDSQPVTFPDMPEGIEAVEFKAILSAYLVDAFEKYNDIAPIYINRQELKELAK